MPNGRGGFGVPKYVKQMDYVMDQSAGDISEIAHEDLMSPTATA